MQFSSIIILTLMVSSVLITQSGNIISQTKSETDSLIDTILTKYVTNEYQKKVDKQGDIVININFTAAINGTLLDIITEELNEELYAHNINYSLEHDNINQIRLHRPLTQAHIDINN